MSSIGLQDEGSHSTTIAEWVDQVADQFDAAWRRGSSPHIADFLSAATGPSRAVLAEELVRIDLEYRCRSGETPKLEDYLQELPELLQADGSIRDDLVRYAAKIQMQFNDGTLPLKVNCPHCGGVISWAGSAAEQISCQNCGGSFRIEPASAFPLPLAELRRTLGKFQLL